MDPIKSSCLLLMCLCITGCTTLATTGTGREICLIWTPATYSASKDSPETIAGNRALNAKRDAFCKGTSK